MGERNAFQVVEGADTAPGGWIVTAVSGSVYRVAVAEDGPATMTRGRGTMPAGPELTLPGIEVHGDGKALELMSWLPQVGLDADAVFIYWPEGRWREMVERSGSVYAGTVRKTLPVVAIQYVASVGDQRSPLDHELTVGLGKAGDQHVFEASTIKVWAMTSGSG